MTTRGEESQDPRGRDASSPAEVPLPGWKSVALRTWKESSADNVGLIAAGVAFYAFLALVPLLGATVLTYGLFTRIDTVTEHVAGLMSMLPADAAKLIGEQLLNVVQTSSGKKGLGLLLALAIALFGARSAAGAIITALNVAYEEEERRGFIRVNLTALAMTAAAVVSAVFGMLGIGALGFLDNLFPSANPVAVAISRVLTYLLLAVFAAAAAATLYRYGPSREDARWRWLTPGSILFAVGWVVLTLGFGFYVANFGKYGATYGSLGAVVVLLTWMYLSAYALLLGAELNSELEHQTARDTTAGPERPLGERGAWSADHVAAHD
jgi:membrane protein